MVRVDPIRVLLIYPPAKQFHRTCPMGILMLSAMLEKAGYEVHLLDACAVKKRRSIEDIVQFALELNPDVIGMTLLTPFVKDSYQLAAALKKEGFKLIAGGPHVTLVPDEVIARDFDALVLGEGEPVIERAVKAILCEISKDDVPGWVYKDSKGKPIYTAPREFLTDLDSLPLPAYHLINQSDYGVSDGRISVVNIFSSRGCPARCSFCAGGLFGKHFRFRSAENIIEEIIHIHKTYGAEHFHFVDDAMTVNRERIRKFCEEFFRLRIPVTWSIMTRVDAVDEEMLKLLSMSGCVQIDYGVESGCAETLRRIHKPHTVEMVKKIVLLTAKYKIRPCVFFILGFPWESADDIDVTFDLIKELAPYIEYFHTAIASILVPFPGTEIYDTYKDKYGFKKWWLNDQRHYERDTGRQAYFEDRLFLRGHVLKADFFHYSDDVKSKIYEIFGFMYKHNTKRYNLLLRSALELLLLVSEKTAKISPAAERALFAPINIARKVFME